MTGREALSNHDVADSISAAIGKPVIDADVPAGEARKGMHDMGLPDWFADDLIKLSALWREGAGEGVTDDVERAAGRPATSYDEFARDDAAVFRGEAPI